MEPLIRYVADGKEGACPKGTLYWDLAKQAQNEKNAKIMLVKLNGNLRELNNPVAEGVSFRFVTTEEAPGRLTYRRSTLLVCLRAFEDVKRSPSAKMLVQFSVSKGLYIELINETADDALLQALNARMHQLVEADLPIKKAVVELEEAIRIFEEAGMDSKANLMKFRRSSFVNIYELDGYKDYYYGYMAPGTGSLDAFELHPYAKGLVLQMPDLGTHDTVPPFEPVNKVADAMLEYTHWGHLMKASNIGELNEIVCHDNAGELVMVQEALMEKKIADIAATIAADPRKRIVLIAGPSSSGKTSFSYRLTVQLKSYGLKPHPIAVDNYFKDRELAPRDENGNYDFEALECVDVELFNRQMNELLAGKRVELPEYNFKTGKPEFKGNMMQLGEKDILVIEGIHCLNDKMSYDLPADCRFRIYISALTALNVDEHNRVATTDGRLLRRIVRDARTRGYTARDTIAMWPNVRKGEEKNIFPYQESADVVFNSALIYELSVLKLYAEPLLFMVPKDCEEYVEAKRLLKFLDYCVAMDGQKVPRNSLIREFMGGSVFPVG